MCIPLKPVFSRHKGDGVQITDEPTGNLDSRASMEVAGLLKTCAAHFHQTVILVTHDEEVAQMADRILSIEDGKIVTGTGRKEAFLAGGSGRPEGRD